jgi:Tfp pilus assembly protein PilN
MRTSIHIDFAKPAWYSIKHVTQLGAGLMLLGVIFFIVVYSFLLKEQRDQLNSDQLAVTKQILMPMQKEPKASEPVMSIAQTQLLTSVIAQLNVPWSELLTALEAMKNPNVALLSVLPNPQKQQLELIGEARNIPALLSYLGALEDLTMLDHVTLQKHTVNESHPYQPVEFVIVARWR